MNLRQIQDIAGHRDVPPWVIKLVQDCIEHDRMYERPSRAAMQMALEALIYEARLTTKGQEAITALREALAQPQGEPVAYVTGTYGDGNVYRGVRSKDSGIQTIVVPQGEPVAWMRENEDCTDCFVWERDEEHTIPLYTTPPSVEAGIAEAYDKGCADGIDITKSQVEAMRIETLDKAAKIADELYANARADEISESIRSIR